MAPAPLQPDEPDYSGHGIVPAARQERQASGGSQAEPAGGAAAGAPGAAPARIYTAMQEFDGDGIPVDPDPGWLSGRWDDSPEAAQYWADLEASLAACLDVPFGSTERVAAEGVFSTKHLATGPTMQTTPRGQLSPMRKAQSAPPGQTPRASLAALNCWVWWAGKSLP